MERWVGKVALVTGASAGAGAAIAVELVQKGLTVVGVARRVEKIQALQSKVKGAPGKLVPMQADISKEEDILKVISNIRSQFKTIHVLVNNAGYGKAGMLIEQDSSDWKGILDVNVMALTIFAREAVKLMRETGVNDGQIINVNSLAGHQVFPMEKQTTNMYPPSKFAVTAISETLRLELRSINTKIRCTNLCPGVIDSEFFDVFTRGGTEDIKTIWDTMVQNTPGLKGEDLAAAVVYILSAPPHVQINDLSFQAI